MPRHYAMGENIQSGSIENPGGGSGFVDVVFAKPFKKKPKVTPGDQISGNNPKPGAITQLTKYGFRYHFGGNSTDVTSVDFLAVED